MPTPDPDTTDRFSDASIDRRTFVQLSAATAGALTLPGNATAVITGQKMTGEYEYVLAHTPVDYRAPTLVTFSDAKGLDVFDDAVGTNVVTTTEPQPAAYAELTTTQAEEIAMLPTAETLSHSPGANPFWRLGYYPFGVFPEPYRSMDYIDYEEMIAGLTHLESRYPDRLDVYTIGQSPGFRNYVSDREDPKDIYVAELTNDINDETAYREKEKVLFSLSIHGLERAGVEAGSRFIENLLDGREGEIEALLDDIVIICVYANPDGWVAKHPQYESTGGAPVVPVYKRGNAAVQDTNRQYPITGWIDPAHYPAEPDGPNYRDDDPGIDSDVPTDILERVPDALAIVDHFRDYENLNYGADLHGAAGVPEFVLGLISQDQFDHRQLHELYEMNREVDEVLEAALSNWNTIADVAQTAVGGDDPTGVLPEQAFDYSAIWDTLGYTDSGFFGDWFSHPEALGSLGMTAMDFEMNLSGGIAYNPEIARMKVLGYVTAIRTMSKFTVTNSDTPNTSDEFTATVETDGLSTAYVTTDTLTRSSDQLTFTDPDDADGGTLPVQQTTESTDIATDPSTVTTDVPADTHTLSVSITPEAEGLAKATLRRPDGAVRRASDPASAERIRDGTIRWVVRDPPPGSWTVQVSQPDVAALAEHIATTSHPAETADVTVATLQSTTETPDPAAAFGYGQRPYKVSPFVFFDKEYIPPDDPLRTNEVDRDYAEVADAPVEGLTIEEVADGLADAYDNLVIIHDEGIEDAAYLDALESFVDAGGNLVLSDSGVHLLGVLDTTMTDAIAPDDVTTDESFYIANLGSKNAGHPLLDGTRDIQRELWKLAGLGYSIANEAPMTLLDQAAFENAGGRVAATTDSRVSAGTLLPADTSGTVREVVRSDAGSVQVISGLFPPAKQTNLHPFGVLDYSLSFLAHTMLSNALGYVQKRFVGDEEVASFGGTASYE